MNESDSSPFVSEQAATARDLAAVQQFHVLGGLGWSGPDRARALASAVATSTATSSRGWRSATVRQFDERAPELDVLMRILSEAYGPPSGHRNVPSAGAIYALTLSLLSFSSGAYWKMSPQGCWRCIEVSNLDADSIHRCIFHQLSGAPALVVISSTLGPYVQKYGPRGYRYALIEAGLLAQETIRLASRTGLAHGVLGAFDDQALRRLLGFELLDLAPLLAIALGFEAHA